MIVVYCNILTVSFDYQETLKKIDIICQEYYEAISYSYSPVACLGFMAVNQPSPRAQPEDKVGLRCHKSLATRLELLYIPPDWSTVT